MGWKVTVEPSVEPVSLSDAKDHLRVSTSDEDALIGRLITAAREQAEQELDRSVARQTVQLLLDEFPDGPIRLPRGPVASVDFVKYVNASGVLTTLSGALYALDDAQIDAWLLPAYDTEWPDTRDQANAVQVQYVAGWADSDCPSVIKQWILLKVGTLFAQRESEGERPAVKSAFADRLLDRYRVKSL